MSSLIPVILSGGAGTRLWPVSRRAFPKPFMRLPNGASLLGLTLQRALAVADADEVVTVTGFDYRFLTADEYARSAPRPFRSRLLLEPAGRNTAPAIVLAALDIAERHGEDAQLLVLPADHLVHDVNAFAKDVAAARALAAQGYLVTMTLYGIVAMLIFFFTFSSTKEVVPPTVNNAHMSLKDSFKGLTGQAWILFFLNLFYFSLYVVRNTTVIYYFKYNLDRSDLLALVGLLGILSGLPMLLALPSLETRFKKRSLMFFSVALYVAGDLLIYFGQSSIFCLLAGLVVTGLGIYGIFGITFAMQPDVIDYSEYKKNQSVAGLIAAFQGFFVKGGMGLTSFVVGLFLNMGGYVPNAVQSASALSAIETCFIWIPIALCAIIAALIYFYKLDYIRTDMTAELDLRRQILASSRENPAIAQAIPQYDPEAKR